jgi:hypothetical protein
MTFKSNWIPATGIALALVGLAGTGAQAQTPLLSYAAKFVCGTRTIDSSVVTGLYETTVNIHNPQFRVVIAQKKAVIALPQSLPPGKISNLVQESFGADGALGVNCRDIRFLFVPPAPGFIEGFLVVYVPAATPLDVVDVITARHRAGADPDVESINVYEVHPIAVTAP